jgi:hypothetical protein
MRRGLSVVLVMFVVGISLFLFDTYKRAAPPNYFLVFVAFAGMVVVTEIFVYGVIRKRLSDNPTMVRVVDLLICIAFGLLLYLFGVYVYPGL